MKRRRFLIHSAAHLVNDSYGAFLSPLLPLLCAKHHIGLTVAGLLVTVQTLSASLSQPLWGYISDRFPSRWFIIGGVITSGAFFSFLGVAPDIYSLAALIFAGGMGIACFHPMGTALASAMVGRRKGLAIALFITAGTTGYALGPVWVSIMVAILGLKHSYFAAIPAILMVIIWAFLGPRIVPRSAAPDKQTNNSTTAQIRVHWSAVALLSGTSIVRALVLLAFINFMPFYLQNRGIGLENRSFYLFMLQFGGAAGSLIGGGLSDRLGRWRTMFFSPILALPFLFSFISSSGALSLLSLFAAGVMLFASAPAVVVASQKLMQRREGLASALQIGLAWGTAGLLMSLVGKTSELYGVYNVLSVIASFPLIMSLFALALKYIRAQLEA